MKLSALWHLAMTHTGSLVAVALCSASLGWAATPAGDSRSGVDGTRKWQLAVGLSPVPGVPSVPEAKGEVVVRATGSVGAEPDLLLEMVVNLDAAAPAVEALSNSFLVLPSRVIVRQHGQPAPVSLEIIIGRSGNRGIDPKTNEAAWMAAESSLALLVALDAIPFRYDDVQDKFGFVRQGCCRLADITVTSPRGTTRLGADDLTRRWGLRDGNCCLVWSYRPYAAGSRIFSCRPPFTATNSLMSRLVTRSGDFYDSRSASVFHAVKRSSFESDEQPYQGEPVARLTRLPVED